MTEAPCYFLKFGLLVTGKTEAAHLDKLFKALMETQVCSFAVLGKIEQLSPMTSRKRLQVIGKRGSVLTKADEQIAFPARNYLVENACHYVLLIDDLEHDRREDMKAIFDRYRTALDTLLTETQRPRMAIHFLVNMVEAYYWADADALNAVLGTRLSDWEGDVEAIRHPKNELKKHFTGFDEIEHGGAILDKLDVKKVLSNPATCAALRTLYLWCIRVLERCPHYEYVSVSDQFQLPLGVLNPITGRQLQSQSR